MINHRQFSLLVYLLNHQEETLTQRDIANDLEISLGLANKIVKELLELNTIEENYDLTPQGFEALKPYKVKRALILAAGTGERLIPETLTRHKSLLKIRGKRIIDSLIEPLLKAGIEAIYVVRGYLGHQFDELLEDYPMITLIDNNEYATTRNISSAYLVKDLFSNAYVLEADILLKNPNIIQAYEYTSHYKTTFVKRCDTWCFESVSNKIKTYRLGGENIHKFNGISYWNHEHGNKLERDIELTYLSPAGKERFWDDVPMRCTKDNYVVEVIDYEEDEIVEIRSVEQLRQLQNETE